MPHISQITFQEANKREDFHALVKRYNDSSKMDGVPDADLQAHVYEHMEANGFFHLFAAQSADQIVGIIAIIVVPAPRHGHPIANVEAFYVEPEHRSSGTAKSLIEQAEAKARELGAVVLSMTAPAQSVAMKVAPFFGFKHSHSVFTKVLQ